MSTLSGKTVALQPINSAEVKVPREVIAMMQTICTMLKDLGLEDTEPDIAIPIQVKAEDFSKVWPSCCLHEC